MREDPGFDLEAALRDLGQRVDFPPTPDVATAVAGRLRTRTRRGPHWRPALLAALAATLVIAAAAAALALALPGLRITLVESLPPTDSDALGSRLSLGDRVSLEQARERAGFAVAVPRDLGLPDEVYASADGEMVSLLYAADEGMPALPGSDVGLLVMQLGGSVGPDHIQKLVNTHASTVTSVSVAGNDGYWIEGEPHVLLYVDADGDEREVSSRLVGDVLIWHADGVLYRVETTLGLEHTLGTAESLAE